MTDYIVRYMNARSVTVPSLSHAETKLDRCVYGQEKPACKDCPIHCYKPDKESKLEVLCDIQALRCFLNIHFSN